MTTIETARALLRPFLRDDIPAYARMRAKPDVVRFLPGGAASVSQADMIAHRIVPAFIQHWKEHGYGPWAMVEKATGTLMGHMGLRHVPELAATEILYMLDTPFWGRGHATEGAAAARDHAFGVLALDKVVAIAAPENRASQRVMEKIGMTFRGPLTYQGLAMVSYVLERGEGSPRETAGPV